MNKITKIILTTTLAATITTSISQAVTNKNPKTNKITSITAAGSSFIFPVMSKWTPQYANKTGVKINYQPIGSGGGIQQFKSHTIDFAGSDEPLRIQDLNRIKAIQFPMVISGIVPIYHLNIHYKQPKKIHIMPTLNLSGPVLADIYQGIILKWNDPKIQKLNPDLSLPNRRILTVHRADGSGTTFNFTNYLSSVSKNWKNKVGFSTVVAWPGKLNMGAKGNAGVVAQVQSLPNSIGYVEYAYAKSNKLQIANMYNKNNKKSPITPNLRSFAAAAKNAKWDSKTGFYQILTNQPGTSSWPIVATTFILLPKAETDKTNKNATSIASICFFNWAFNNGNNMAKQLNYIGMPKNVQDQIRKVWKSNYPSYDKNCPN